MQVSLFDRKRRFLLLIRRIRKLVQYNGAMTSTGASVLLVARCALMSYLYQYLLQYIVADVQYQYILVTAAICDHHIAMRTSWTSWTSTSPCCTSTTPQVDDCSRSLSISRLTKHFLLQPLIRGEVALKLVIIKPPFPTALECIE